MTHSHRNDGDLVTGAEQHDDQHEPAPAPRAMANDAAAVEAEAARERVEGRKLRGDGDDGGAAFPASSTRPLDEEDGEARAAGNGSSGGTPAPRWQYVGDASGWLGAGRVDTARFGATSLPSWVRRST